MENDKKLGQEPAFPEQTWEYDGQNNVLNSQNPGMSKRFYAANIAMQGLLSNYKISIGIPNVNQNSMEDSLKREKQIIKDIITKSYEFADELLKQENL